MNFSRRRQCFVVVVDYAIRSSLQHWLQLFVQWNYFCVKSAILLLLNPIADELAINNAARIRVIIQKFRRSVVGLGERHFCVIIIGNILCCAKRLLYTRIVCWSPIDFMARVCSIRMRWCLVVAFQWAGSCNELSNLVPIDTFHPQIRCRAKGAHNSMPPPLLNLTFLFLSRYYSWLPTPSLYLFSVATIC